MGAVSICILNWLLTEADNGLPKMVRLPIAGTRSITTKLSTAMVPVLRTVISQSTAVLGLPVALFAKLPFRFPFTFLSIPIAANAQILKDV